MKEQYLKSKLLETTKRLNLRPPQVQLLLAQERFLARVASVDLDNKLVWKGGSLILRRYTTISPPRFTVDIDLLVRNISIDDGEQLLKKAFAVDLGDGFKFVAITNQVPMQREDIYGGQRFEIAWELFKKKNSESLKIDLCCSGDDVDPLLINMNELSLIPDENESLTLAIYPPEFIIAEKLETIFRFGRGNTRLKDFIDLWGFTQMSPQVDANKCRAAIRRCFKRRETELSMDNLRIILNDKDFVQIMDGALERNFSKLNLPSIRIIFSDLYEYFRSIGP